MTFPAQFPGNREFTARDRPHFHGRAVETAELADLWQRQEITILHGESGAGKSSLLHAGVIPALRDGARRVLPPALPGYRPALPLAAIPRQNPFAFAILASWRPEVAPTRLAGLTAAAFLRGIAGPDAHGPAHLAIDRAEELFAPSAAEAARVAFLNDLAEALSGHAGFRLLLCVREERLPEALAFASRLSEPGRMLLGPLDRAAAAAAIRGPLGPHGDPDLPDRLAADLAGGRQGRGRDEAAWVEPSLLQPVCARLFGPDAAGGPGHDLGPDVDQALADHTAAVLARVAAGHRMTPAALTGWFRDVFAPRSGGARVAYEDGPKTAGMPAAVIRDLVDGHLLRAHRHRDGLLFYRLTHPRLVRPVRALHPAPAFRPSPEDHLQAADKALHWGEHALAQANAEAACKSEGSLRVHAAAETTLGNIAYERGLAEAAAAHYRAAAVAYEAVQDTTAVGRLLAAIGRLRLGHGTSPERAVADLNSAVGRVPHDPAIQTGLGRALWFAGRPVPALAVLTGVLALDGGTLEALGTRAEILADLGDPVSAASALRDLDRLTAPLPPAQAARALALAVLNRPAEARAALPDPDASPADSSLVLLRAARVAALTGDPATAARLATRATQATDPPLPAHLHPTAHHLTSSAN
ncbi:hypothetical protein EDD29_8365 [Actinocorallia herbida]|uniref:Novel STAND NTPase 1 domain-containing protein n=1 Tax=Actinocorallia herbida TaxID=58109 RepID=A0A3N1DAS8_9ACTN|nr:hypothetical protein [Actinocorallia herbida]ROO90632.1 hypothetical protein EDD29_8365 [Actinocorallia herbida]